jgi:hypothetical protein
MKKEEKRGALISVVETTRNVRAEVKLTACRFYFDGYSK